MSVRLVRWVATVGGVGYSPVAPGTVGTLVGVLVVWRLGTGPGLWILTSLGALIGVAVLSAFERHVGTKDPSAAVLDEVVGYWACVAAMPYTAGIALCSFLLFRLFDILKPFPAREVEACRGGWGIMCDDLVCAVYVQLLLRGGIWVGWLG